MAVRTTSALVRGVLGENYNNRSSLTPFINAANILTDRVATCATEKEMTLTSTELEIIETWLAAHFYAQMDQLYSAKRTGNSAAGAYGQFQGKTDMHLQSTLYGQTAMTLDYSGCLASFGATERKVAGGFWAGRPPSEQTNYEDRD